MSVAEGLGYKSKVFEDDRIDSNSSWWLGKRFPLKIKHLPGSSPKYNIVDVLRHRFSSAGCCRRIILLLGHNGGLGIELQKHTEDGRLKIMIF